MEPFQKAIGSFIGSQRYDFEFKGFDRIIGRRHLGEL
jgi:hypothetical protein